MNELIPIVSQKIPLNIKGLRRVRMENLVCLCLTVCVCVCGVCACVRVDRCGCVCVFVCAGGWVWCVFVHGSVCLNVLSLGVGVVCADNSPRCFSVLAIQKTLWILLVVKLR